MPEISSGSSIGQTPLPTAANAGTAGSTAAAKPATGSASNAATTPATTLSQSEIISTVLKTVMTALTQIIGNMMTGRTGLAGTAGIAGTAGNAGSVGLAGTAGTVGGAGNAQPFSGFFASPTPQAPGVSPLGASPLGASPLGASPLGASSLGGISPFAGLGASPLGGISPVGGFGAADPFGLTGTANLGGGVAGLSALTSQIPLLGSPLPNVGGAQPTLNNISILNGANPLIRQFGDATFRLSGGANIPSAQPVKVLPQSPGFLTGLASIAESGGLDPLTGEFQGALGPIAASLRQASLGVTLSLRGIV